MSKVPASTSVEEDVMERIKMIAKVDRRSVWLCAVLIHILDPQDPEKS